MSVYCAGVPSGREQDKEESDVVLNAWKSAARACVAVAAVAVVGGGIPAVAAASLPDNRAYEQVSPPDKNGGDVVAEPSRTRVAVNGNAASFISLAGFGDTLGTGVSAEYMSTRDGKPNTNGWSTHAILPQVEALNILGASKTMGPMYLNELSPDLSRGVLRTFTNLSGDPNLDAVSSLYMRDDLLSPGAGSYELMSPCAVCVTPLALTFVTPNPNIIGATADLGHVVFESRYKLTADAPAQPGPCNTSGNACRPVLYEWDHGTLRYVGILPVSEGGGAALRSLGGGYGPGGTPRYLLHVISDDGSRIFFTVPETNGDGAGALYMRVDHTSTVRIDASERTDCDGDLTCGGNGTPDLTPDPAGTKPANFETASGDGAKVFFTSLEQMTDDDTNQASDLYMYDASFPASDPHHLTRLSVSEIPNGATGVLGAIGASDDGNYVYFVARNQLVAGGPPVNYGVYLWHAGHLTYVANLTNDNNDTLFNVLGASVSGQRLSSRVTPDGKHLVLYSHDGLTGYDQGTTGCGGSNLNACSELYLYDADANTLKCASCNPSGDAATSDADFISSTGRGAAAAQPHMTHPLSDDGRYVFFTSGERLVPGDRNGKKRDVYEYDAATDSIHLITTGRSVDDSFFLDATPTGSDVFFATREQLVGWDKDNSYDLYDARVNGGFPEPAVAPVACVGDACQGAVATPPDAALSASSGFFSGDDNVKPSATSKHKAKRCKRGTVRKRVRGKVKCVKRAHRAASHTAERSSRSAAQRGTK